MKVSELLSKAVWETVKRGRMERIAWVDGYLMVVYQKADAIYVHGPDVPKGEVEKLLRVPYPDSILAANKKKHNWQSYKIEVK